MAHAKHPVNWDRQMSTDIKGICKGHKARYKFAASRVNGYVLDAACGVGYGSHMMSFNADVTGIDIEPEAIEIAQAHYSGPTYKVADVCDPQGAFDWVVSLETIEHLKEPEKALRAFRDSGNLIISTPNQQSNPFYPSAHKGSKYPHQKHYTPKEFEALLDGCGWKVVERYGQQTKKSEVTRGNGVFMVWVCT